MKPLSEMTTEELWEALIALDASRPEDTALRLALRLELRRAAAREWPPDDAPTPGSAGRAGSQDG
ncbi:hypothetical protein BJF83_11370 [Nocardiopsis sp. CNR-923]|uniref:hypothetical protein n=1 Tax=Nocardiopsis sp. CNR-923 TaxID=1904965 RepID=UPI0009612852|nr:hypothetical protein [Nocardiopsis sp. CNR-923]OLT29493.1 hypothetical protein BJF83_11370 [Nocardiopsis sp. CNR-923]